MTTVTKHKLPWFAAYTAFLADKQESTILKLAPIALLFGSPEIIASNVIPVIGEIVDFSALSIAVVVVVRTVMALRRHR
ncbi:MAG: hypothetical protein NVS1B7_5030 [Candidatus Saccharimonadales bacterium]